MDTTFNATAGRNRLADTPLADPPNPQSAAAAEIERLAASDIDEPTFFAKFIELAATALQADAGAVWMLDNRGSIGLLSESKFESLKLDQNPTAGQQNMQLVADVLKSETATVHVPGQAGSTQLPTSHVHLLTPISFGEQVIGAIQVFLPQESPVEQRLDFLQWTEELAAYATRYLQWREEAGSATNHLGFWNQFETYLADIHRSLHPKEVAMTAVNDGRQLLRADRVSLAIKHGPKTEIIAISGQDRVRRRSNLVRQMRLLCKQVARAKQSVTYAGRMEQVPPPLERALSDYIQESGSRMVRIVPLTEPDRLIDPRVDKKSHNTGKTFGALVVEQTDEAWLTPLTAERIDIVASHTASAMHNARNYHRVFLLPLWSALGRVAGTLRGRTLLKLIFAMALLAGIVGALMFIPAEYRVEGTGKLMPVVQQDVFAPWEGKVVEVYTTSGARVQAGQPLLRLQNDDLNQKLVEVASSLQEKNQQLVSLQAGFESASRDAKRQELIEISGKRAQVLVEKAGLEQRKKSLDAQLQQLTIRAPISGTVATFQLEQLLMNRPVERGEKLVEIMDEEGDWHLELLVPERRLGHLLAAQQSHSTAALPVDFVLATDPENSFTGTLHAMASRTDVSAEHGSIIAVHAAVDKSQLPGRRIGSEVQGKIHCGEKSLFTVLFGDVVEFVQRHWW